MSRGDIFPVRMIVYGYGARDTPPSLPSYMPRFSVPFAIATLVAMPFMVSAHMAAGEDITVGSYVLDLGFAPEFPVAGQLSDISINLVDAESEMPVDIDEAWVRIGGKDGLVFSGSFRPVDGNVTFSIAVPEAGDHEVKVLFKDHGETLVDHTFQLPVAAAEMGAPSGQGLPTGAVATVSAVFGAVLMWFMTSGRRRQAKTE